MKLEMEAVRERGEEGRGSYSMGATLREREPLKGGFEDIFCVMSNVTFSYPCSALLAEHN